MRRYQRSCCGVASGNSTLPNNFLNANEDSQAVSGCSARIVTAHFTAGADGLSP